MASTSAPQPANNMARSPSAHPMSATGRPAMSDVCSSDLGEMSSVTVGTHESVSNGYQSPSASCVFFFSSLSFTQSSWAELRNASGLSGIRKGIQAVTPYCTPSVIRCEWPSWDQSAPRAAPEGSCPPVSSTSTIQPRSRTSASHPAGCPREALASAARVHTPAPIPAEHPPVPPRLLAATPFAKYRPNPRPAPSARRSLYCVAIPQTKAVHEFRWPPAEMRWPRTRLALEPARFGPPFSIPQSAPGSAHLRWAVHDPRFG